VQTQHIWPGELAQPGSAIVAVLDPKDKYVQLWAPVAEVGEFRLGRRVAFELDSLPGRRIPGEVSFVADQASFTPEKIETRSDRMAQVYRVKVRLHEEVEKLQPGTEGNVYLVTGS
jgi:HlyD family secretion protein